MCWRFHRIVAASGAACREARAHVLDQLSAVLDAPPHGALDDVELIISELVSNAVQAGSDTLVTACELHRRVLLVSVADDAYGWPTRSAPCRTPVTGRG
jgi:hypothetical protein